MEVNIYGYGPVSCSACAPKDMSRKEVERQVNVQNPTGISSHWKISDELFANGSANPHECENDSTRVHYLLHC